MIVIAAGVGALPWRITSVAERGIMREQRLRREDGGFGADRQRDRVGRARVDHALPVAARQDDFREKRALTHMCHTDTRDRAAQRRDHRLRQIVGQGAFNRHALWQRALANSNPSNWARAKML